MLCNKAVTPKKIEANRRNAQRSTGPRTDRGKLASKFNAVTLGLFAKHVVIFVCDGHGSEKQFHKLLEALREDFQPEGTFEEWLVLKIAEGMWRLRRATRSENGSVRNSAIWDDRAPEKDDLTEAMDREVDLLTIAEEQIQAKGTVSEETYEKVLPLVEDERRLDDEESEMEFTPTDANIDNEFSRCIRNRKISLEQQVTGSMKFSAERLSDHLAYQALPPAEEMAKILRYESRVQKQLDWALRRLLECQQRRNQSRIVQGPVLVPLPNNAKRSQ